MINRLTLEERTMTLNRPREGILRLITDIEPSKTFFSPQARSKKKGRNKNTSMGDLDMIEPETIKNIKSESALTRFSEEPNNKN